MAFFAGNEVVNDDTNVPVATWVKAVVRDMKQYITAQSARYIPTGYSAADVANSRLPLAEYFNCGSNDTRTDFYAFNTYEWCGASSYTTSGYSQLVAGFSNYSAPLFFSEYGCNLVMPRAFTEVEAIYSTDMTPVFSGGLVYEYSQEESNYGLVSVSGTSVSLLTDYNNLKSEFAKTPNPTGSGGYATGRTASTCPSNTTTFAGVWAEDVLPAQPAGAAQYIKSGAGKALGNTAGSSQDVGAQAVSNVTAGTVSAASGTSASTARASGTSAAASSTATTKSASSQVTYSMSVGALFVALSALGLLL